MDLQLHLQLFFIDSEAIKVHGGYRPFIKSTGGSKAQPPHLTLGRSSHFTFPSSAMTALVSIVHDVILPVNIKLLSCHRLTI